MTPARQPHRRHDLVRADPAAWAEMLSRRADLDREAIRDSGAPGVEARLVDVATIAGWAEAGRPLIVRRFDRCDRRDHVPLGLALPPEREMRRTGFELPPAALTPVPAPTLIEARACVPATWRAALDALGNVGRRHGIVPRPFGGLLWQAATGLRYLHAGSDLDLLWPLPQRLCPPGLLAGLSAIAATAPMRLDGEILLPDGAGLHWRELAGPGDREVLVKHLDRLELRPAHDVLAREAA